MVQTSFTMLSLAGLGLRPPPGRKIFDFFVYEHDFGINAFELGKIFMLLARGRFTELCIRR